MERSHMKIKIISLLICTLFLISIFSGLTTAKNNVNINTSFSDSPNDLSNNRDLIKITDKDSMCDLDTDFVVYTSGANVLYDHLYVYNINTEETDDLFLGGDMVFPKIAEHKIVFYDFTYEGFKMYNIDTSEITDLIVTHWPGGESDSFQFFGDYIVYENTNLGLEDTEIFLYNIATDENIQLSDSPDESYSEKPCIYGDIVAWQFTESNLNTDIIMYNIDSEKYTRVTNTSNHVEQETFPSIFEDTMIYHYHFYDKANGTEHFGMKMYTISTGEETTLFIREESTGRNPEIFGDIIAYSKSETDPEEAGLYLYDLNTNSNTSIYQGYMLAYPWNLNGNYIAFTLALDGIYLYKYNTQPVPYVEIGNITGGLFKVKAVIKNTGDAAATNVQWTIKLTGGLIILGAESTGTIPTLAAGATADISSKIILGLGKTVITVTTDTATKSQNATVLLVFIK